MCEVRIWEDKWGSRKLLLQSGRGDEAEDENRGSNSAVQAQEAGVGKRLTVVWT